jgi:hypothetical protein
MHAARAQAPPPRAEDHKDDASRCDARADAWQQRALAAERRVEAARH